MQLLVLSDIHGNLSALNAVFDDVRCRFSPDAVALLGDNIDYGQRSNEVVEVLQNLTLPVVCSIWGNHEDAILNSRFDKFSSERGVACAKHTAGLFNDETRSWLLENPCADGMKEFEWGGRRVLAVHGSLADPLWKAIDPNSVDLEAYKSYDMVLSGHSHIPHAFTALVADEHSELRGKKAIWFLNPGSVGQPRNHDPRASYAIWDTDYGISLNMVSYDIRAEQALFDGSVDDFYRDRLEAGI